MEGIAQRLISVLEMLDKQATLSLNAASGPVGDVIWAFVSDRFVWVPLYLAIIVLLFVRLGWRRALVALVALVLTVVACDQCANLVKYAACRLRPCHDEWMLARGLDLLENAGSPYGFFSAHAANAFGLAVGTTVFFAQEKTAGHGWYALGIFLWAALVAASRIFVGKHFLGDVLVGTLAGIILGGVICSLAALLMRRISTGRS